MASGIVVVVSFPRPARVCRTSLIHITCKVRIMYITVHFENHNKDTLFQKSLYIHNTDLAGDMDERRTAYTRGSWETDYYNNSRLSKKCLKRQ